jgi:predicted Zn-dependent protease
MGPRSVQSPYLSRRARARIAALGALVAVLWSGRAVDAHEARPRTTRSAEADELLPEGASTALVAALRAELDRARTLQMEGAPAAYFLAYRVLEVDEVELVAEQGSLVMEQGGPRRFLRVEVRAGDPAEGGGGQAMGDSGAAALTIDDDVDVLRRQIWLATDESYKAAIEAIESRRAERAARGDTRGLPDFSAEPTHTTVVDTRAPPIDRAGLVALAERLSGLMRDAEHVHEGGVMARAVTVRRYFLSSEGSFGYEPSTFLRIGAVARTQAGDGMNLLHFDEVVAAHPDALPPEPELVRRVQAMLGELSALRDAPPARPYVGPVIFEGQAAGMLLSQLVAPQLVGVPAADAGTNDQLTTAAGELGVESALGRRVGKRVAPEWLSAFDDPALRSPAGRPLPGTYAFDDEGVPGQRVSLIDDGKLQSFVTSRAPIARTHRSTGHGRGGLARVQAVTSNLVVRSERRRSAAELRRAALREAKEVGEPGAMIVRRLDDSGLTQLYRGVDGGGGAFGTGPLILHAVRLRPDGTEEPVRGLAAVALDIRSLRDLMATGDTPATYSYTTSSTGSGGSGFWRSFPVYEVGCSVTAPSLLFSELELVPDPSLRSSPPVIPPPGGVSTSAPSGSR